jgi:hypothetical protein
MVDAMEKRRIAQEVFAITGVAVPEDDALVLAALFYSNKMQEASREAAAVVRQAAASNKALADAFEARLQKALRQAAKSQSRDQGPPQSWRGVLAGVALGIFIALGTMLVACDFSLTWFSDARFGAEWKHTLPSLDPALRDKMIEHYQKHRR